ncbi:MAG: GNAT family N-acetyltransferase [Candidatus Nanopelagicales bacterium]
MQISQDPEALRTSLEWARTEGWNPGPFDQPAFVAVDPDGWFSAKGSDGGTEAADSSSEIVTTLGAVRYDDSFGFIGLYITRPESRGQGIGRQVWALGREHLAEVACIGLDAVVEREATYASDGFIRSHETSRYVGNVGALREALHATPAATGSEPLNLAPASEIGGAKLSAFEQEHEVFPAPRAGFIDEWIKQPDSTALVLVNSGNQIQGWGQVRLSADGRRIGPLFAQNFDQARLLLLELIKDLDDTDSIAIDVPESNTVAVAFMTSAGFTPSFTCVRMYVGEPPRLDLTKVFGNTTFELG